MWTTTDELLKATETAFSAALTNGYLSIGIEYQEESLKTLVVLQGHIEEYLKDSILRKDEDSANLAWIFNCFAKGINEFISMWIHLKKDQMESAWESLVTAQDCLEIGLQLRYVRGLDHLSHNLHAAEVLLFPPSKFFSRRLLFCRSECS